MESHCLPGSHTALMNARPSAAIHNAKEPIFEDIEHCTLPQVLFVAELLHQVSARFDKCRAQRYQQMSNSRRPAASRPAAAGARVQRPLLGVAMGG